MNRYRGPPSNNASKAGANTLCQKCLKRDMYYEIRLLLPSANLALRHYSFECKAAVQERPYISRPSRTQQLHNPKLTPQLNSDVPNDLLRKYARTSAFLLERQNLRAPLGKEWRMKFLLAHLEGANAPANPLTSRPLIESVHEAIHAAAFLPYPP